MEYYHANYSVIPDKNGICRIGIQFFLKRIGASIPVSPDCLFQLQLNQDSHSIFELNLPAIMERSILVTSRVGQAT